MLKRIELFLFSVCLSCSAFTQESIDTVIYNVNIVDVLSGAVLPGRSISIAAGRIVEIRPVDELEIGDYDQVIDASNFYAVPGLADMHVHMGEADLPLFLANGITTVIEMNGSPEKLALRARVATGELTGPRIFMTSPLLAGSEQNFAFELVDDAETASQMVRRSKELGYDFIKVYDGLSREAYGAIVETAERVNIPLLGHIPASVSLSIVLDDGFKSVEHVEQIARAELGHSFDRQRIPEIVSLFTGRTVAVTPTLAAMEILSSTNTLWFDSLYEREEMQFVPDEVSGWWQSMRRPPSSRSSLQQGPPGGNGNVIAFYRELTRQLAEAGVPLLAGTDTPNPLLLPGFSLHHEFAALARAGLDNLKILQMSTINASRHLQTESEFGEIKKGVAADILVLRRNPLTDLSALKNIEGIYTKGAWLSSSELESLLE